MGKLEADVRHKIRRTKINNALIAAAAVVGGVTIAAIAPNVLGVVAKSKYFRQRKYQLKSSLSRLIAAGYLVLVSEDGRKCIRLTPKGERYAALMGKGR